MKLSVIVLSLFSILLISCSVTKKATREADNDQVITDKYWKLISLNGQSVKMVENQEREIYFILKSENNTFAGFAGCNNITGSYTIAKGNIIRFQNMGATLKMCPDVELNEMDFQEVFEVADNYTILQ